MQSHDEHSSFINLLRAENSSATLSNSYLITNEKGSVFKDVGPLKSYYYVVNSLNLLYIYSILFYANCSLYCI